MKTIKVPEIAVGESVSTAVQQSDAKQIKILVKEERYKPKETFALLFISNSIEISLKLNYSDFKVLLAYAEAMEYGNQISICQSDIAKRLGITQPSVARSLKKLKDLGVVYSPPDLPNSLYMDPSIIAKGNLDQFKSKLEKKKIA